MRPQSRRTSKKKDEYWTHICQGAVNRPVSDALLRAACINRQLFAYNFGVSPKRGCECSECWVTACFHFP